MKQDAFEAAHAKSWETFAGWIRLLSGQAGKSVAHRRLREQIGREFPAMYRKICHHLALARARRYSLALEHRLNQLALEGHQFLYRSRMPFVSTVVRFLVQGFPVALRRYWRYWLAGSLLLYLPALGMAVAMASDPDLVYALLEPLEVATIEEMYNPENSVLGRERESDSDLYMFGFYIYNNISIGFRTFAGGLLFGIGSLFFLAFNGLFLGTVASHLTAIGYTSTFWPFVAGHSALELTAITIFGAVGLMLGHGAVAPGRRKRWHAIRNQAIAAMPLIYGGTAMLIAAAFVEAFWSSTTWPPVGLKYAVGGLLWLLHAIYFGFAGRHES